MSFKGGETEAICESGSSGRALPVERTHVVVMKTKYLSDSRLNV